MKNKRFVIFFTVLLTVLCVYTLSFTLVTRKVENKGRVYATRNGVFNPDLYKNYLDSMGRQNVYNLGIKKFTYLECKKYALKLGLDLQGGMNVVLEVSKTEFVKSLAGKNAVGDKQFEAALKKSQDQYAANSGDFVDIFTKNLKELSPGKTLSQYFTLPDNKASNATDQDVVRYIKEQLDGAISRTRQVVETRLNQSSAMQPTVQQLDGGRISVELPGVDNPERMRKLLQGSAKLEFWRVYGNTIKNGNQANGKAYELYGAASRALAIKNKLKKGTGDTSALAAEGSKPVNSLGDELFNETIVKDSGKVLSKADSLIADSVKKAKDDAAAANSNPLAEAGLDPPYNDAGKFVAMPVFGMAFNENRAKINALLNDPDVIKALPSDIRFKWSAKENRNNQFELYALKAERDGNAALFGDRIIEDAGASPGQTGGVEISMRMTQSAASTWKKLTGSSMDEFIAIVLDDQIYSAPKVNGEIPNGMSSISGSFDQKEAEDLANILKAGKLPAPTSIVAEDVVGPTLGKESIQQGLNAMLLGIVMVILIMGLYYMRAGYYAIIAVLLNIFFIIGILASYDAALTLSGIAGIVLTMGMAVDANVLIYERIKEELFAGKSLRLAVSNGFNAAFSSIIDSNLTTLIAGIVMLFAGSGPVYSFAITLIIGILSSLFTAIYVTRLLMERRLDKGKTISIYNNLTKTVLLGKNFNFIGNRKKYYAISSIIIIAGMITLFAKGGLTTGIDFKGGRGYQIKMANNLSAEQIKGTLDQQLPGSSNEVKTIGSDGRYKIVTTYLLDKQDVKSDSVQNSVINALKTYNVKKEDILSTSEVGPTMASESRGRSAIVFLVAMFLIFLYVLIRFKDVSFALGALAALIHDVLIVFSLYAFLDGYLPFAMELDQTLIAAILTIVGYSINDTVVVFDRIREFTTNFKAEKNIGKVINDAINQTLSRTIMTSLTTLAVVVVLLIFGGPALKSFSFALVIGIVAGTYSSICIATPIVVDFIKKDKNNPNLAVKS
ncbi:MAG: protein translocase subunit SecDF [Bacteroidia bacterium]|nr:protein translocase subunit SecDF [Bacteroidia bacterium]